MIQVLTEIYEVYDECERKMTIRYRKKLQPPEQTTVIFFELRKKRKGGSR